MQDLLKKIPLDEKALPELQDFDCGSEPWEVPLSTWIKAPANNKNGAAYLAKKGK